MRRIRLLTQFLWRAAVMAACCAAAPACFAQGVEITAGSSSLLGVQGMTATQYAGDRTTVASIGVNPRGLVLGGAVEMRRPDGFTRYGDSAVGFTLPTDMDPAGRAVGGRGLAWEHDVAGLRVQTFAGKTGNIYGLGYVHAVASERWLSSVQVDRALNGRWRVTGIGAAGATHAALAAAEYVRSEAAKFSFTTGWNAGHGVASAAMTLKGETWTARVQETLGRMELRPDTSAPHTVNTFSVPEREGLNFAAEKRFAYWLHGDAERVQYAQDKDAGLPDGASLHEAGITAHRDGLQAGLRVLTSRDGPNHATGSAALVSWTRQALSLQMAVLDSHHSGQARSVSADSTATIAIGEHARLTGGVVFGSSSPAALAGGEWRDRWGSIGASERMVYVPFGAHAGFTRVTEVSLHLHPKGVETSLDTLVGRGVPWSYTAVADRFVETGGGKEDSALPAHTRPAAEPARYVVRGQVLDESGAPVAGAAVQVNTTTVWTNSEGQWEHRGRRPQAAKVHLVTAEFVTPRAYAAAQPDSDAVYAAESDAQPLLLRVKACAHCDAPAMASEHTAAVEPHTAVQKASKPTGRIAWFVHELGVAAHQARAWMWREA